MTIADHLHSAARAFLLVVALLGAMPIEPSAAQSAPPGRTYRLVAIAANIGDSAGALTHWKSALQIRDGLIDELARLGFVEARNLVVDLRVPRDRDLDMVAAELMAAKPDVVVVASEAAARAAISASRSAPIVMLGDDPVESGLAASLARPGGRVTGTTPMNRELDLKRLQLIYEALPSAKTLAVLIRNGARDGAARGDRLDDAASRLGLKLHRFEAVGHSDYASLFERIRASGAEGVILVADPVLARDAEVLATLSKIAAMPMICDSPDMARERIMAPPDTARIDHGCLIAYGPHRQELARQIARYVARIFRGASPAELPIEGPTRYELVVNLRTAQAIGVMLPQSLLMVADEVVE
ncbi:MAG: hypothetical protein FJX57_12940 [Alphaproteobacteria bacterium]|nr:hypothetical protein [Alphaproteobacteria bacterium]